MEKREGVPLEEARKKIFMRDSRGLIVKGRSSGGISRHKEVFAQEHAEMMELGAIVKDVKPTVLIGAAAQPNVFTEEIVKDMCAFTEHPVIFALSNPTSKAECTAEQVGHVEDQCGIQLSKNYIFCLKRFGQLSPCILSENLSEIMRATYSGLHILGGESHICLWVSFPCL